MASRHHSLDLSETADVITTIRSFEEHCQIRLVVGLSVLTIGKTPNLFVTASAYPSDMVNVEAAPLACVTTTALGTKLKHLKDVLTHVLYLLDGNLAWKEMRGEE